MNIPKEFEIAYPRLRFRRKTLNLLGRALLRLLTRAQISGLENIPAEGPVILAGNHVSTLEPLLMAVYPSRLVELIGAGDLPFEGLIDKIVAFYGFIPINRGNLDRTAMSQAVGVLKQDGVLGIFPEGGTWDPGRMKAQVGVAWLSHRAQAPVVPIGFSGFRNSLGRVLKLKRPKIQMRVGQPIPALKLENEDRTIKDVYQEYADSVLERINLLVDPADFLLVPEDRQYGLRVQVESASGAHEEAALAGGRELAEFLFSEVMLNSMANNLKKPVQPLYPTEMNRKSQEFSEAWRSVLEVLAENPGFFTYRMGVEQGHQAEAAVRALLNLLEHAREVNHTVSMEVSSRLVYHDGRVEEKTHQYRIAP